MTASSPSSYPTPPPLFSDNPHAHTCKQTVGRFPSLDELEDVRDAALAQEGGEGNRGLLSELGRFIDSFKRM